MITRVFTTLTFMAMGFLLTAAQTLPAYQLYNQAGDPVEYSELLTAASQADVVLFGELHNNSLIHWLQRQLTEDLIAMERPLALGAEMFERDDQRVLNEYLAGIIRETDFEKEAKLWNNYETDYKPLVQLAEEHGLPFIATNVPRRYAALVSREGAAALDNLPAEAQANFAALPYPIDYALPGYAAFEAMMAGHGGDIDAGKMIEAQALKDATMAESILAHLPAGGTLVHYNGSYHSKDFEGIVWYLRQANPDLNIVTIHAVEQPDVRALSEDNTGHATYTIAVPANMAKSY